MNKEFYRLKTEVIRALANPTRLMIIDSLRNGEKNVSELVDLTKEEQSTISKNLSILKNNGLIKDRKSGLNVFYSLKICCIDEFFNCLDNIIKENIEYKKELLDLYKAENK